uniref:Bone morphogenetic protein 3 n=1 Tax=Ascaris suum TaxID=6253 RepID=F1L0N1_ASCSU
MRPVSRTADAASKYMQKLFEQYQKDDRLGHAEGNIVRSISPTIGSFLGEEVLSFKLSTIKPSEQIIRAQLHYNIRHKHRSSRAKARKWVGAIALCTTSTSCARPGGVKLRSKLDSDNWLSFDATQLITDALLDNRTHINVQFLRKGKPMECYDLVRRNTPFLLIYSNSPALLDKEKMQSALYAQDDDIKEGSLKEESRGRKKRSSGYYSYSKNEGDINEEARVHLHVQQFRNMGPRMLQSRKQLRKPQFHREKTRTSTIDPMMGFGTEATEASEMNAHSEPSKNHDDLTVVLLGGAQHIEQKCGKRKLLVQFRDIGWEHWIIAPKSFEAHYCSGSCPFPLQKEVNPSNHAIVQSIIHTIGLNPYVPAVCCAPDKMDSLTLLYFDEMDNVVLKNYPKMIVSSCACI